MNDLEHSYDTAHTYEASLADLAADIMNDVRKLFEQQLALFKEEVKRDLTKLKRGGAALAAGAGALGGGMLFLLLALVHGLTAGTAMPLWLSYLIVGGGLVLIGVAAAVRGKSQLDDVSPVPPKSAAALKETVQCLINPK